MTTTTAASNSGATTTTTTATATTATTTATTTVQRDQLKPLEIDALVQLNLSTRRDMETWVKEQTDSILQEKRTHDQHMQDTARQTNTAQQKRQVLQQQQQLLATESHEKETESNAYQVEIEVLQAEKSKKEPVLKDLFVRNQEEDNKLKQLVNESQQQQTLHEQQLAELRQGLAAYQRLGLFFEPTGDRLVVRFTQIDPADPDRVFSFTLNIHPETDQYIVDECSESVPSLTALIDDLNQSGDLPFFIRSMRREFKAFV